MRRLHVSTAVWAFVDLLFNVLLVTLFINSMMTIPQPKADPAKESGVTPGRMCVVMSWPDDRRDDLDLWGRGPEGAIVYYKAKSSRDMDLLRDDLGDGPPDEHHFETMCSRALTPGEWTFNASFYNMMGDTAGDVPVSAVVSWPGGVGGREQAPVKVKAVLHQIGDEVTLLDFRLDGRGMLVPSSINHVLQSLRR